jgi:hypothetical protein
MFLVVDKSEKAKKLPIGEQFGLFSEQSKAITFAKTRGYGNNMFSDWFEGSALKIGHALTQVGGDTDIMIINLEAQ